MDSFLMTIFLLIVIKSNNIYLQTAGHLKYNTQPFKPPNKVVVTYVRYPEGTKKQKEKPIRSKSQYHCFCLYADQKAPFPIGANQSASSLSNVEWKSVPWALNVALS